MEEQLKTSLETEFAKGKINGIQCFDASGLPLITVGQCDAQASNTLCSIYRRAALAVGNESINPVVIIERERSRILMSQHNDYTTVVYKKWQR